MLHEAYPDPKDAEFVQRDFLVWVGEHFPDRAAFGEVTVDGAHYLYGPLELGPWSVATAMMLADNPALHPDQPGGLYLHGEGDWGD